MKTMNRTGATVAALGLTLTLLAPYATAQRGNGGRRAGSVPSTATLAPCPRMNGAGGGFGRDAGMNRGNGQGLIRFLGLTEKQIPEFQKQQMAHRDAVTKIAADSTVSPAEKQARIVAERDRFFRTLAPLLTPAQQQKLGEWNRVNPPGANGGSGLGPGGGAGRGRGMGQGRGGGMGRGAGYAPNCPWRTAP